MCKAKQKGQAIPVQAYYRPLGFQEAEAPRYLDSRHMKVVRLSGLRTGRLYSPGNILGTHLCYWLIRPQGHSEAGRMSMKNSNDPIGNRTRGISSATVTKSNSVRGVAWSHTRLLLFSTGSFWFTWKFTGWTKYERLNSTGWILHEYRFSVAKHPSYGPQKIT